VEQVHGKLRLKCQKCDRTRPLNRKQEIVNCDHAAEKRRKKKDTNNSDE
jgi:hypothetical protein